MNTVVWLMYLADLASGVSTLLILGGVFTLIACGVYRITRYVGDDNFGCPTPNPKPLFPVKPYVIGSVAAFAVCALIPSKTTIYAAAAVTAGDKALATPTGDKVVRALNAWLDRQIADDKK